MLSLYLLFTPTASLTSPVSSILSFVVSLPLRLRGFENLYSRTRKKLQLHFNRKPTTIAHTSLPSCVSFTLLAVICVLRICVDPCESIIPEITVASRCCACCSTVNSIKAIKERNIYAIFMLKCSSWLLGESNGSKESNSNRAGLFPRQILMPSSSARRRIEQFDPPPQLDSNCGNEVHVKLRKEVHVKFKPYVYLSAALHPLL